MDIAIRNVTIEDYDKIYELWNSTEQSRRALNPVDDSREGIDRYLRRNPATCFLACPEEDPRQVNEVNSGIIRISPMSAIASVLSDRAMIALISL